MVYIKRDLMIATYKRDMGLFKGILFQTAWMSVLSSLIFATHRYLKERLTNVWREKLTAQLHRSYFKGMNYYKLSHLNKSEIDDVEERIVKDPSTLYKGPCCGDGKTVRSNDLWRLVHVQAFHNLIPAVRALSPLLYFYTAFQASKLVAPNWSMQWRKMLDLRARYFSTQSRLQLHSEAVCAYQGNDLERSIIESAWDTFRSFCRGYVREASLFTFVIAAMFEYGGHSFAETLIISRFISPTSPAQLQFDSLATSDKAAAVAQLFGQLRYLTEYFIRAMSAQGIIVGVLRQLQQMKGPAARLTQLYDTLDRFSKEKKDSTTFVDSPDCHRI